MRNFIVVSLINAFALFMVAHIVNGITINGWQTLAASAIALTLITMFLKPIISFITLPINIFSLGFFSLIVNAFLLYIVGKLIKGFIVADFITAFIGALLLSIITILVDVLIVKDRTRVLKKYGTIQAQDYKTGKVVIDVDDINKINKN